MELKVDWLEYGILNGTGKNKKKDNLRINQICIFSFLVTTGFKTMGLDSKFVNFILP